MSFARLSFALLVRAAPAVLLASPSFAQTGTVALEEIVVTAQKRSENLQNVPIAVQAVTAAQIESAGISNIQDMQTIVPGFSANVVAGYASTHLRGVGAGFFGAGTENPIALYVDGVYYGGAFSGLIDFVSVSQIEVLKGPQGTLFGRNASGGLLHVRTKDPSSAAEFSAHLGYGNYDSVTGDAYVSGPISSSVSANFAIEASHQGKGWGTNLTNGLPVNRNDHSVNARSKFLYELGTDTRILANFDYSDSRNSNLAFHIVPGGIIVVAAGTPIPSGGFSGGGPRSWDSAANQQPLISNQQGGASLAFEQNLGFARISNIAAFRKASGHSEYDTDGTSVINSGGNYYQFDDQFTDELQLQSNEDSKLQWVVGAFYLSWRSKQDPHDIYGRSLTNPYYISRRDIGTVVTDSLAGFAQGTYEILADTNLTLGGRYTHERRRARAESLNNPAGGGVFSITNRFTASTSYNEPTWRVALDHKFNDDVMIYASASRGFKAGGYNLASLGQAPYQPERINAYEVGLKSDLFDHRVRVNAAGFYYDYTSVQVQQAIAGVSFITNGSGAHLYGFDLDAEAQLTKEFKLTAGLEALHAKYTVFAGLTCAPPTGGPTRTCAGNGNDLPYAPRFVFDGAVVYTVDFAGGSLASQVNVEYSSSYFLKPENVVKQEQFARIGANITWTSPDDHYSVALWARNLTNKAIMAQSSFSTIAGTGQANAIALYREPRLFGIRLGYKM